MSNEKSVTELLEDIAQEICDRFCKYPEIAKTEAGDPDLADDFLFDKYCAKCPFSRL